MPSIPHATLITGGTKNLRCKKGLNLVFNLIGEEPTQHPDFIELTSDKISGKIGIDKIRELKRVTQFKPYKSKNKVVLIQKAENLSIEAQHSFLKLLEEPPGTTFFILTAKHKKRLLPTIVSRCRLINLKGKVDLEFDTDDYQKAASDFINLLKFDIGKRFDWVEQNLSNINYQILTIYTLDIWASLLRDLLFIKYEIGGGLINKRYLNLLSSFQNSFSKKQLTNCIKEVETGRELIRTTNVDKRLLIETLLLEIPTTVRGKEKK